MCNIPLPLLPRHRPLHHFYSVLRCYSNVEDILHKRDDDNDDDDDDDVVVVVSGCAASSRKHLSLAIKVEYLRSVLHVHHRFFFVS